MKILGVIMMLFSLVLMVNSAFQMGDPYTYGMHQPSFLNWLDMLSPVNLIHVLVASPMLIAYFIIGFELWRLNR